MTKDNESLAKKPSTPNELDFSRDSGTLSPEEFPEGGLRAWSVVFGVWLIQFCTFGYTEAFGVYNDFYTREYLVEKYTPSQIGWIGSIQIFTLLLIGLFTGRWFDTGYFYHMMFGGSILYIFSLFMLSLSKPEQYYQVFLAQGLGNGLAIGIMYVPSLALIPQYFFRRRAFAMGIATTGAAMGALLYPIMLNNLFHNSVGFHNGVRASAGLNAGMLLIALCLVKPRLPPSPRTGGSLVKSLGQFLRDPPYVVATFGSTFILTGLFFPVFFLQLYAITLGIDTTFAFYSITILNGASIMGRSANLLVPRLGVFNVTITCVAACGIMVFFLLLVKTIAGVVIFAIFYGFFYGAYTGLLPPMIGSLAVTDAEIGARLGINCAFTAIGGLIGSPIAGALLSTHFVWWKPIIFSGLCTGSGVACFCVSRFLVSRRKGTQFL